MTFSTDQHRALAVAFFKALERADVEAIVDAYDDEGKCHTMGNTLISGIFDKEQIRVGAAAVLGSFPQGLTFTLHNITAEGDRVAVEAESSGMHVSGRHYNNKYHFFMRFRNGKLLEFKEYMDTELVTEILCCGRRREGV